MALERAGFAEGNREGRDVYARRIAHFPQGALMACLGTRVVGCAFMEIWPWHPQPAADLFTLGHDVTLSHDPRGTELYVASMTLDPQTRGQGLGRPLMLESLRQLASGFPHLASALLLVNTAWPRARAIYESLGFVEVAHLPGFFAPTVHAREDGLVMRRPLHGLPEA